MARRSRRGRQPEPAEVTIAHLPEDCLKLVLQRILPQPGVLIGPAAFQNRCHFVQQFYAFGTDFGTYNGHWHDGWRACLEGIDAPPALLETPPWDVGLEGDELYGEPCLPALGANKTWRRLLLPCCKVAVCGIGELPPPSTAVLVLSSACPWHPDDAQANISYLQGLPALKSLIVCYVRDAWRPRASSNAVSLPAVPAGLREQLRHLVYVDLRSHVALGVDVRQSGALLPSIAACAQLETLSIAEVCNLGSRAGSQNPTFSELPICGLRKLRTLLMPCLRYDDHCCTALTAVRSVALTAPKCIPCVDLSAFAHLVQLEDLSLHSRIRGIEQRVAGVGALTQLRTLYLMGFCLRGSTEAFTTLTALSWLGISTGFYSDVDAEIDKKLVKALAASPHLPHLSLSVTLNGDFRRLEPLTSLRSLSVSMPRDAVEDSCQVEGRCLGKLASLSLLTSLSLSWCRLNKGLVRAFGGLSHLRGLTLAECEMCKPQAIRSLGALESLCMEGRCCPDSEGSQAWLKQMQLSASCPALETLMLRVEGLSVSRECISDLGKLTGLQELALTRGEVDARGVKRLWGLQRLRAVRLSACVELTDSCFRHLQRCGSLQYFSATCLVRDLETASQVDALRVKMAGSLQPRVCISK